MLTFTSAHIHATLKRLWWSVRHWGSFSFFLLFFFVPFPQLLSPEDLVNACKMFESLKLPLRWVWLVLCICARFHAFRPGFVFIKGIYRAGLAPASQRPGSSCPASCCWKRCPALCDCHFLSLPGVWKETLACFLTTLVRVAPNCLLCCDQLPIYINKISLQQKSVDQISLSHTHTLSCICLCLFILYLFFVGCVCLTVVWWWSSCSLTVKRKW